jgi:orotate phosphoribosyltransferase
MEPEAGLRLFETVGAIRHGHFELTSGLHSDAYVQWALALQYPKYEEQLGRALAPFFQDLRIECVTSPALGGVLVGHEVARALPPHPDGTPVPAIFLERDAKGTLTLRRGFRVAPEERNLVVEDVWTTGGPRERRCA